MSVLDKLRRGSQPWPGHCDDLGVGLSGDDARKLLALYRAVNLARQHAIEDEGKWRSEDWDAVTEALRAIEEKE